MKKQVILLLILILFLFVFCSCKSRQKSIMEYAITSVDSSRWEKGDSIHLHLIKNTDISRLLSFRQINFSPPDTLARQFIQSVIRADLQSVINAEEEINHSYQKQEKAAHVYQENRSEKTELTPASGIFLHKSGMLLLILLSLILFIKFRKI